MKHLIILGDGMADWPVPELGGHTLLEQVPTPHIDRLARLGRTGMLQTVPQGFHPGSEVANSAILGYDQHQVYQGRGPLEAASMGVELAPDDLALRCNLIAVDGPRIKNHSCGHLSTDEGRALIAYLEQELGGGAVHFYAGVQYRHLLVVRGGDARVACTPPHDVPGQAFAPLLPRALCPEAEPTAQLLRRLIAESQRLLANHPLNVARRERGGDAAASIWPWAGGHKPHYRPMQERFSQIKRGSVITAVDLIRGIGRYAGLNPISVQGATGLYDTNYEGKARAALEALRHDDFVYLHIEAPDEAGHDGNVPLKMRTIADIDRRVVGPIVQELERRHQPVSIALLPDHPTPCAHRTHTADPVPFLIYYPGIAPDGVQSFGERACRAGSYGLLHGDEFINEFMKN